VEESLPQNMNLAAVYGFVPNLFLCQNELPRAIEAEERLINAVVVRESRLSRGQKEAILHCVADVQKNDYCRALYGHALPTTSGGDSALFTFAIKLTKYMPWFSRSDAQALRQRNFDDESLLEAASTTALGQMLCTLADGLSPASDPRLTPASCGEFPAVQKPTAWVETQAPYLSFPAEPLEKSPSCMFFGQEYGFIPNLFRVQSVRPDLVEAEAGALAHIMLSEDLLSRIQKEQILVTVSAANLNTYCFTMGCQILSVLGALPGDANEIIEHQHLGDLSPADKTLLDETVKLAAQVKRSRGRFDGERLRTLGFSKPQIVEAVAVAGLANFLNTLQAGVGAVPDFPPPRIFTPKDLYPSHDQLRPISNAGHPEDPDAEIVARVQNEDIDAFEEIVRRHSRRVYGVLAGLVGNMEDVQDLTQDVFLKAFEHIGAFQRRSKFSTWLTSIAINTGIQLLRDRKPSEPLFEEEDDEAFRPRQIQDWAENPEQLVAASQRDELVRAAVLRLPEKYRVAVLLRDIEQLSTEEAATALGVSIPAMKARVLRGRLMLRESLTPYFIRTQKRES
jgi:RNA polymerase sigma-70 factor, ECF subfamily